MNNFQVAEGAEIVRTHYTGDKIYLLQEGKRYWIKNPETLEELGFRFGQEKVIEIGDLNKNEDGGMLDFSGKQPKGLIEPTTTTQNKSPLNYRKTA